MITHVVHFAYEVVEKVADEAPGPDPDAGKPFVWIGALGGAYLFGSQTLHIIGSPKTDEDVTHVVLAGAMGAVSGAGAGLLAWMIVLLAMTIFARSRRTTATQNHRMEADAARSVPHDEVPLAHRTPAPRATPRSSVPGQRPEGQEHDKAPAVAHEASSAGVPITEILDRIAQDKGMTERAHVIVPPPTWVPGQQYASGAVVRYGPSVYSVKPGCRSALAVAPPNDSATWQRIGEAAD